MTMTMYEGATLNLSDTKGTYIVILICNSFINHKFLLLLLDLLQQKYKKSIIFLIVPIFEINKLINKDEATEIKKDEDN